MTTGRYIAFEGLEGCGKSTHVTRLADALGGVATREPGGTAIGASLRTAMLDASNTKLSPRAEALMMSADRAQHLDELVLPTLRAGKHVVSDRSAFSSLAYQGYGRMLDIDELNHATILWNLYKRYIVDDIYTYVGPTLLAVNPFKRMDKKYPPT